MTDVTQIDSLTGSHNWGDLSYFGSVHLGYFHHFDGLESANSSPFLTVCRRTICQIEMSSKWCNAEARERHHRHCDITKESQSTTDTV